MTRRVDDISGGDLRNLADELRSKIKSGVIVLGSATDGKVTLLTAVTKDLVDRIPALFQDWQRWAVEVLDSHVAYPLLGYFRSSHDDLSWLSALGTVLDRRRRVELRARAAGQRERGGEGGELEGVAGRCHAGLLCWW